MTAEYLSKETSLPPLAGSKIWLRLTVEGLLRLWLRRLRCRGGNVVKLFDYENPEFRALRQNILRRHAKRQEDFHRVFTPYYQWCPGCRIPCCVVHESYCRPGEPCRSPVSPLDALIQGEPRARITHDFKEGVEREIRQKLKNLWGVWGYPPSAEQIAAFLQCPELGPAGCRLPWGRRSDVCILPLCALFAAQMSWRDYGRYLRAYLRYLVHLHRAIDEIYEHAPAMNRAES